MAQLRLVFFFSLPEFYNRNVLSKSEKFSLSQCFQKVVIWCCNKTNFTTFCSKVC